MLPCGVEHALEPTYHSRRKHAPRIRFDRTLSLIGSPRGTAFTSYFSRDCISFQPGHTAAVTFAPNSRAFGGRTRGIFADQDGDCACDARTDDAPTVSLRTSQACAPARPCMQGCPPFASPYLNSRSTDTPRPRRRCSHRRSPEPKIPLRRAEVLSRTCDVRTRSVSARFRFDPFAKR